MLPEQLLNELSGIDIPDTKIKQIALGAELRFLERLRIDFELTSDEESAILLGLYQFKETLKHFYQKWNEGIQELSSEQQKEASDILSQVGYNIDRDSRSCFSASNFFGKLRFLLEACRKLNTPSTRRKKYLKLVLHFPITPIRDIRNLFEHELYPANLPHVYMDMAAGMIRGELVMKTKHTDILRNFRTFQWERNKRFAHNTWFKRRLAGSVCTKK